MIELNFSDEDIRGFIEKEIPDSEKPDLLKLLSAQDSDETSLEAVCEKYLEAAFIQSGETSIQGIRGEMPIKIGVSINWEGLKRAASELEAKIYEILCTGKNKECFDTIAGLVEKITPLIAVFVKPAQAVIVPATALAIYLAKIGVQKWCKCKSNKYTPIGGQ
jgi:hypothetical protein